MTTSWTYAAAAIALILTLLLVSLLSAAEVLGPADLSGRWAGVMDIPMQYAGVMEFP